MPAPLLARVRTAPLRRRLAREDPEHPLVVAWAGFWQHADDLDTINTARIQLGGDRGLRVEPDPGVGDLILAAAEA